MQLAQSVTIIGNTMWVKKGLFLGVDNFAMVNGRKLHNFVYKA